MSGRIFAFGGKAHMRWLALQVVRTNILEFTDGSPLPGIKRHDANLTPCPLSALSGHASPRLRMSALALKRPLLAQSEHSAKGANRTAHSQVGSGRCAASSAERFRPVVRFLGAFRLFTGLSALACLGGGGGTGLMFLSRLTKASA